MSAADKMGSGLSVRICSSKKIAGASAQGTSAQRAEEEGATWKGTALESSVPVRGLGVGLLLKGA